MKALLVEAMKTPSVIEIEDSLFCFQRIIGNHFEIADDFREPFVIIFNDAAPRDTISNIFFICDSCRRSRYLIRERFIVAGVNGDRLCSLSDEQIERYQRIFQSTVLYFPMYDEEEYHCAIGEWGKKCWETDRNSKLKQKEEAKRHGFKV